MSRRETVEGDAAGRVFRFADVVVDGPAHVLTRAGEPQALEPKAFAVLVALLQRPGELIPRDELIDQVWGHHHVTPGVLTRVIAQLRNVLGDDPHHPRYIQTQHALGYRFIGELLDPDAGDAEAAAGRESEPGFSLPTPELLALGAANDGEGGFAAPIRDPEMRSRADDDEAGDPAPVRDPDLRSRADDAVSPGWRRPPRRLWMLGALALVLAAVLGWQQRTAPALPAEASIAVLPFTSLSSDRKDAYFAEGLAVEMHDALAGVRGLKVAARTSADAGKAGEADIRRLGRTLGVATVLDASVRREGRRVRVSARLSDTATGFTLWSESYDRELSDVFGVQTEIANEVVRELLGVLPGDPGILRRRLAPTRNVSAFDAYLKGLHALRDNASADSTDRSIRFFGEALAADRDFARAQAGICRAEIRRLESMRDARAFARAQQACQRAAAMDPGLREVSLAFGEIHRVQGRSDAAIEQYNKALQDPALRADAYIGLARTESTRDRGALALEYYRRALALRPGDGVVYRELGYHHYLAGDLPKAIEAYRTAATLKPDDSGLWSSLGGLYLASGDHARAAESFNRSLAIKPNYSALSNLGTLRYMGGDYAQAATLFRRAAGHMPDDYRPWGNVGDALLADPATAPQAREAYRRAAALARRYVAVKAGDAQARAQLGWFEANLGDAQAARAWLAEARAIGTEQGEVALWAAQTFALLGDEAAATEQLALARRHGIPQQRIDAPPILRRLARAAPAAGAAAATR